MHGVLKAIGDGESWQSVTTSQFDGQGSWGNGAAMRVAPLGAWFADDLDREVAHRRGPGNHGGSTARSAAER
jgi:ADP-ribosylglycohydrolase